MSDGQNDSEGTSSRAGSRVETRVSSPDNAPQTLYTPRTIVSDEEIEMTPQGVSQFTNNHVNVRSSRPHFLFTSEAKTNVADGSHIDYMSLDRNKSSRKSSELSHVPNTDLTMEQGDEDAETLPTSSHAVPLRRKSTNSSKKVRWPEQCTNSTILRNMEGSEAGGQHLSPQTRIQMTEGLLTIRDMLVDIVLYLKSNNFGGANFKWDPKSSTLPQNLSIRIPNAFKNFTDPTP